MALTDKLTAIANAIRSKTSTTEQMTLDEMATAVEGIETGGGSDNIADDIIDKCISGKYVNPNVTLIGTYVFYRCNLITDVEFPNVTRINAYAFDECRNLITAKFPNTTYIGDSAFRNCFSLTTVTFPKLTEIKHGVFYGCTRLTTLVLYDTSTICTLSNISAFFNTPIASGTGYIYVPDDLVESYKSTTNWSTYADQIKPLSELPEETA